MARTKVPMSYIPDESARKSTLKKRKKGLIKKVHELSTLCGVDCCTVIYTPNCPEPDVWPSCLETELVIGRYRDMPDFERFRMMADQESIAKEELDKEEEQLKKVQKENRLKELSIFMNNMSNNREWVQSLDYNCLTYINNYVLQPQLEETEKRVATFQQEPSATPQQ